MKVAEARLEEAIECGLLVGGPDACADGGVVGEAPTPYGDAPGGYARRSSTDYDARSCLDPDVAVDFVIATQPKAWGRDVKQQGPLALSVADAMYDSRVAPDEVALVGHHGSLTSRELLVPALVLTR